MRSRSSLRDESNLANAFSRFLFAVSLFLLIFFSIVNVFDSFIISVLGTNVNDNVGFFFFLKDV